MLNSGLNYYEWSFVNEGGLVMPIILQIDYADGLLADESARLLRGFFRARR